MYAQIAECKERCLCGDTRFRLTRFFFVIVLLSCVVRMSFFLVSVLSSSLLFATSSPLVHQI